MDNKMNLIAEYKRQLRDINTYLTLSVQEMEMLIAKLKQVYRKLLIDIKSMVCVTKKKKVSFK